VSHSSAGAPIIFFECHGLGGNQEFAYNIKKKQIYHKISNSCLDSNKDRKEIFMNPCSDTALSQQWEFEAYNVTLIERDFKF
jgi:polypeptide N-acetylgalactosaminyltransferase